MIRPPDSNICARGSTRARVTTLGRALADVLAVPHHDTDDYFWLPTTPPYQTIRQPAAALRLMHEMFAGRADWVLSGSVGSWAAPIVPLFDLVVLLKTPTAIRLQRLRDRGSRHFGAEATALGGWRNPATEEFLDWASHYDDGTREGRNLARHLAWLETLTCPVLRADGSRSVPELVQETVAALGDQTTAR